MTKKRITLFYIGDKVIYNPNGLREFTDGWTMHLSIGKTYTVLEVGGNGQYIGISTDDYYTDLWFPVSFFVPAEKLEL